MISLIKKLKIWNGSKMIDTKTLSLQSRIRTSRICYHNAPAWYIFTYRTSCSNSNSIFDIIRLKKFLNID